MGYIFDSYPLPLLRRLTVGAAIEKNFFIFFRISFRLAVIFISMLYSFDSYVEFNYLVYITIYGFDIISRFRISVPKFLLVF